MEKSMSNINSRAIIPIFSVFFTLGVRITAGQSYGYGYGNNGYGLTCYQLLGNPVGVGVASPWLSGNYWGAGTVNNLMSSFGYGGYGGNYGSGYGGGNYGNIYGTPLTCPGYASACYKYVCLGNTYFIQKGCLDQSSPVTLSGCSALEGQCRLQGGFGTCYVCNRNMCNSALGIRTGADQMNWWRRTLLWTMFCLLPLFFIHRTFF